MPIAAGLVGKKEEVLNDAIIYPSFKWKERRLHPGQDLCIALEPWNSLRILFFTPLSQELSLLQLFYRILVMGHRTTMSRGCLGR
jgi:hypothetical protein